MAIGTPTSLGSDASTTGASTYTLVTTAIAPAGSLLIVVASWGSATDRTGTLSGGGLTWTTDQSNVFTSGYNYRFGIFSAPVGSDVASATTLTLTLTGAADGASRSACYVTGLDTGASRKDTSTGTGASTSAWSSGSATTANADDLLIGGSFIDASTSSTPGGGATELFDFTNPNVWTHTTTYQIVASTGSKSLTGTWLVSAPEVSAFAAYKAAGGGGAAVVKQLAALGVG